jgi:hypothetical protein
MVEYIKVNRYNYETPFPVLKHIKYSGYKEITFTFRMKSSKAQRSQAAVVWIDNDFVGDVFVNDEKIKLPKKKWRKLVLWEKDGKIKFWSDSPCDDEIKIKFVFKKGYVIICNGYDPMFEEEMQYKYCDVDDAILMVEPISENENIVRCKEIKGHGEFDDLVFYMKVELGEEIDLQDS